MENNKYIVQIFISKDFDSMPVEDDFNGNGIIIGNYLITAGHVVENNETPAKPVKNVWFKFENELYKISEAPLCFEKGEQYQKIGDKTLLKLDLAIYSIEEKIHSSIEFVDNQKEYTNCSYYGYSMNEETKQLMTNHTNSIKVYTNTPERRQDVVYISN